MHRHTLATGMKAPQEIMAIVQSGITGRELCANSMKTPAVLGPGEPHKAACLHLIPLAWQFLEVSVN